MNTFKTPHVESKGWFRRSAGVLEKESGRRTRGLRVISAVELHGLAHEVHLLGHLPVPGVQGRGLRRRRHADLSLCEAASHLARQHLPEEDERRDAEAGNHDHVGHEQVGVAKLTFLTAQVQGANPGLRKVALQKVLHDTGLHKGLQSDKQKLHYYLKNYKYVHIL